eukprot:scaffold101072_cov66-Phaeocystis_antarctica.AAC.2
MTAALGSLSSGSTSVDENLLAIAIDGGGSLRLPPPSRDGGAGGGAYLADHRACCAYVVNYRSSV